MTDVDLTLHHLTTGALNELVRHVRYDVLRGFADISTDEGPKGEDFSEWMTNRGEVLCLATPFDLERRAAEEWSGVALTAAAAAALAEPQPCRDCNGTGAEMFDVGDQSLPCITCAGTGRVSA